MNRRKRWQWSAETLRFATLFLLAANVHYSYAKSRLPEWALQSDPPNHNVDELTKEIDTAINLVDKLYNDTEDQMAHQLNAVEKMMQAKKFWAVHTLSDRTARERAFSALISVAATERLKKRNFDTDSFEVLRKGAELVDGICLYDKPTTQCDHEHMYRRVDGLCNNVYNRRWGGTYEPFQRFLPADYGDGVSELRLSSVDGSALPNPRLLSNLLFREPSKPMSQVVALTSHWAFFVFTDLAHIGSAQLFTDGKQFPLPCCSEAGANHPECAPISVSKDDPRYGGFVDCIDYARTMAAPKVTCQLGPREQANQATSFLDASTIYGSTYERMRLLRSFHDGRLLTSIDSVTGQELPPTMDLLERALSPQCANSALASCFVSGSEHVNFLPSLTALHALWIRQHNGIAHKLLDLNKHWTDEQLFQESRRIVIAQIQHATYNEFLPLLVGRETWKRYGLDPHQPPVGASTGDTYDMRIEPTVLNSYAAAVGQFFFTMFDSRLAQYKSDGFRFMDRPLSEYLNEPSSLLFNDKIDGILRYLIRQPVQPVGLHMTMEFREKLFRNNANLGLDLAALILQTGRDHGIPSYTAWRERCGGTKVSTFEQLASDLAEPDRIVPILKRHFKSVEDVDLFILGLAEKPVKGSLVGPTFGCVLSLQFQKTKRGDRYWYENTIGPWAFTEEQLTEIRKTSMAQIICENTDLGSVQPHAFSAADLYDNFPVHCNSSMLSSPNYGAWKDVESQVQMPITENTVRKALQIGLRAVEERYQRERENIKKNQGQFHKGDPLFSYSKMMRPKPEARRVSRMAEVLLEATRYLMSSESELIDTNRVDGGHSNPLDVESLQRMLPQVDVSTFVGNIVPFLGEEGTVEKCLPKDLPCDHTSSYRTPSGWCNNLRFPHYGNAFGPLRHLLKPVYDDGINAPRNTTKRGTPLPSPRIISNTMHIDLPFDHAKFTHMVMQFGQLLDHEVTHSPVHRGPDNQIINCTRCDSPYKISEHCMPLYVPEGDPHFPTHNEDGERRCLPFVRSLLGQLNLGYRNQLNQLTSFIDGSAFYGSTVCEAAELRLFTGGRLNFTILGAFNPEALPQGDQEQDCRGKPLYPCFVAGDERNSHQPGLTTMHTIFLREHNRIARQLEILNPLWDDERLYQETRKIIGAIFQHLVYNEYMQKLVGRQVAAKYELIPQQSGYYTGYDATCDASISHPFATAAFRFGHTLVRRMFPRMTTTYRNYTEPVDLVENFNHMEAVYDEKSGGIDTLLVGLLATPSMAFDRHITNALRNHLFAIRNVPKSGLDLIALNILRARDHGVQPYNDLREHCGLPRAKTFADLSTEMDPQSIAALQSVYDDVNDIDLFPGLFSERPMPGALMPPTMACIIAEQFQRLKKCDRFYYENNIPETKFTQEQLAEIRKMRLGTILCQNSKFLTKIQPDVFNMPDNLANAQVPCADFPRMNLAKWMDRPVCFIGNDQVPRGATKLKSPCVKCTCTAEGPKCRAVRVLNCNNLLDNFLLADIRQDMSCVVQCSPFINQRLGRR